MTKTIPPKLKHHILPFNWDVTKIWSLPAPISQESIQTYTYLLELPLWSSVPGKGMLFDTSPMDVLNQPARFPHQTQRIQQADISYPIDFIIYQQRKWILDGVHRLAKYYNHNAIQIPVRIHPKTIIPLIRTK